VRIDPALWSDNIFPDHLRVRVEVVDNQDRVVGASRDLAEIQTHVDTRQRDVSKHASTVDTSPWRAARTKWEGEPVNDWKFGDLPVQILVTEHHGVPVLAYPGLKAMPAGVAVRLSATPEEAAAMTRDGLRKLFELQLRFDLGWLERDLKALRTLGTLMVTLTTPEALQGDALESIRRWVCDPARLMGKPANGAGLSAEEKRAKDNVSTLTTARFAAALMAAKDDLRGLVPKLGDWLKETFTLRLALEMNKQAYPGMPEDLAALLPPDFLRRMPFLRVQHLPRYLRGMQARAERWKRDAAKDATRAKELVPFVVAWRKLAGVATGGRDQVLESRRKAAPTVQHAESVESFRWLVEEFRVSLFAQELGTAEPVSVVRLQRMLEDINKGGAVNSPSTAEETRRGAESAPFLKPSTAAKKAAPLKSLGSLDQLFRK
jgi:ATP-dependent helicase HrpA